MALSLTLLPVLTDIEAGVHFCPVMLTGADPGGGGPGGQEPPFLGTPKLHKEGKKTVTHVRAKTPHFST